MSSYQFPVHRFNWVPSPWKQIENERAKMAAFNARFESNINTFSASLFSAITGQMTGSAASAAQQALTRAQAQVGSTSSSGTAAGSLVNTVA